MPSTHVNKTFASPSLHRFSHHVTPSMPIYTASNHTSSHDRETKRIPTHQNVSINGFRFTDTIQSETATPTGAWANTSTYSDFKLNNSLHIIDELFLQFDYQFVSHASSGNGNVATPRPGYMLVDRIELRMEGSSQASCVLRGIDQANLFLAQTTEEEYKREAASYGYNPTNRGGLVALSAATGNSQTQTKTHKLRIRGPFESSKIFAAGFAQDVIIRVHWAEQHSATITGSPTVTLQNCKLLVSELQLSEQDYQNQMALYRSAQGVSIRWPEYKTSSHNFTVTNGQSIQQVLNSHMGYTDHMVVFVRSQSTTALNEFTLVPLTDLQIHDERNVRITSLLDDATLKSQIAKQSQLPSAGQGVTAAAYYIPFSLDASSLYSNGTSTGGIVLTGRDRLTLTGSASMASTNGGAVVVEVVSVSPAWMEIRHGVVRMIKS